VHISSSPVTKSLSGEQKNITAPAASSGVPSRPSGLIAITLSSYLVMEAAALTRIKRPTARSTDFVCNVVYFLQVGLT